jgi:hypothetical protein
VKLESSAVSTAHQQNDLYEWRKHYGGGSQQIEKKVETCLKKKMPS